MKGSGEKHFFQKKVTYGGWRGVLYRCQKKSPLKIGASLGRSVVGRDSLKWSSLALLGKKCKLYALRRGRVVYSFNTKKIDF